MSALTKTGATHAGPASFASRGSETVKEGEGNSISSQTGILRPDNNNPGVHIQQAQPKSNPFFSFSLFSRASHAQNNTHIENLLDEDLSPLPTSKQLPAKIAKENKQVRESMFSRISQSFSKFISYFAFPKMSFPKSMAAQKEEAIANVLSKDTKDTRKNVADLLKKGSMCTDNLASQQADGLIREAYGKRAVESLSSKIAGNEDSIASDLKKAMPDMINNKDEMITQIINFLNDPLIPDKAKEILKKKIVTDNCSNDMLNNALQSCTDGDFNKLEGKLRNTIEAERLKHIEESEHPYEAAKQDPPNIPKKTLQYYRDIISFLKNPTVDYKVKQQFLDRIDNGELPPQTTDEDIADATHVGASKEAPKKKAASSVDTNDTDVSSVDEESEESVWREVHSDLDQNEVRDDT
ncbi:MAG: hypothetical protein K2W97_04900 [Chthoniobacterales bacterium]|nr:hypothetical protein [Chthoniobacterales bacterium]